jgi:tRNA threonylcarbamoyladenosine biosynthesis protein TsaE
LPLVNASVADLVIAVATHGDAPAMVEVIHAAFGARPPLDPPSTAVDETAESISDLLAVGGGIYAEVDGQPAGSIVITGLSDTLATFQRVSVHPDFQRHGVASAMVGSALSYAAELGFSRVELFARAEFDELIAFWQHRGFTPVRPQPHGVILGRELPTALVVPTAVEMQQVGARLARLLRPGDVLIASGELGAGKTTLTQGIAAGLGVQGHVISPTFVLSRIHPARPDQDLDGAPSLVHVDAYRLSGAVELDDLDLDATLGSSVTVVEWGEGIAEGLADDRLEIEIIRSGAAGGASGHAGTAAGVDRQDPPDPRTMIITAVGDRWRGVDLTRLLDEESESTVRDA